MTALYVLDVPEYAPLARAASSDTQFTVVKAGSYFKIVTTGRLTIERSDTGLGPAVWFGALVAGFDGKIVEYSDRRLVIDPA